MTLQDPLSLSSAAAVAILIAVSADEKKIVRLSLRITPDLSKSLRQTAETEDRSVNWLVNKLLEDGLKARRKYSIANHRIELNEKE